MAFPLLSIVERENENRGSLFVASVVSAMAKLGVTRPIPAAVAPKRKARLERLVCISSSYS